MKILVTGAKGFVGKNLVEALKGFAVHEKQVIDSVVAARSGYLGSYNNKFKPNKKCCCDCLINNN